MDKKQINEHIYVGELNTLKVNRVSEPGIYLFFVHLVFPFLF
jgi:hypothetical protein